MFNLTQLIERMKLKRLGDEMVSVNILLDGAEPAPDSALMEPTAEEELLEDDNLDYGALDPEIDEDAHAPIPMAATPRSVAKRRKRPKYGVRGTVGPSPRFTWKEVTCTDGTPLPWAQRPNAVRVSRSMNNLRVRVARRYGVKPSQVFITVNSWYRTPSWNRKIGGEPNSQHLTGKAMDVVVTVKTRRGSKRVPPKTLFAISSNCYRFKHGGRGVYPNFNHFDVGPGPRVW